MNKPFLGLSVLSVLLAGCATAPLKTTPAHALPREERHSRSSAILNEHLAGTGAPSIVAALVDSTGTLWKETRGVAAFGTALPADSGTRYSIASLSKVFTALSVYALAVQGKVHLDSGVASVLPEFRVRCPESRCAPITIRQLLTHSSGLPRGELFVWHPLTGSRLMEKLADVPLVYLPGTRFSYSNLGYGVLGEIVERASGLDFRSFVSREILVPLGMKSTGFLPEDTLIPNRAIGHSIPGRRPLAQPLTDSEGGMYSSLADLSRFTTWLLAGARLPNHGETGAPLLDSLVEPFRTSVAFPEDPYCAFGRMRIKNGHRTPYKTGFIDGFSSGIFLDLEKKVGVIALSNRDLDVDVTGLKLLDFFTDAEEGVVSLTTAPHPGFSRADSLSDLVRFQGRYVLGIDYPVPVADLDPIPGGLKSGFRNMTIYSHGIQAGWMDLRLTRKWDRQWLFFKKEYPVASPQLGFVSRGDKRYVSMRANSGVEISAETPEAGRGFTQWEALSGTWVDSAGYSVEIFKDKGMLFFKDLKINKVWQLEPVTGEFATAGGPCRSQGLNMVLRKDGRIDYRMGLILERRAAR